MRSIKEIIDFSMKPWRMWMPTVQGLLIENQAGGMPGAFSAGGDLFFMAPGKGRKIFRHRCFSKRRPGWNSKRKIFNLSGGGRTIRNDPWRRV